MTYQYDVDFDNDAEPESDFMSDKSFNLKGGGASDKAGDDFVPTHNIIIDFCLKGEQKGEKIIIDGRVFYSANLKGLVPSGNHNIGPMTTDFSEDYDESYEEDDNDLESQATVVAYLDDLQARKVESGRTVWKLNDNSVLRVIKDEDCLMFDFSDLFNESNLPETLRKFVPSDEIMFDNLSIDLESLDDELEFEWEEKDKGIRITGWLKVEEI
ncbi:MAG TPA: hypothetical protein PLB38_00355 [bacterium]|nr:hypothetical protein [bacterium]